MPTQRALNSAEIDKLQAQIKDIRTTMFTTQALSGELHTRPMAALQMDPDGTMWFFTYKESNKVDEIGKDNRVALGFSDPGSETYVATSGVAEEVSDPAKVNELWSDYLKTWFPGGKDDPSLTLLKVTTHAGEYWDRPGGKMMLLFEVVKGALTGESDKSGRDEKLGAEPQ